MEIRLTGDYAARVDNQAKGENVGGFLHKTLRIAGSGIYRYHRSEASLFDLNPAELAGDQMFFNVYRPPEVLKKHKDMFARIPLITGKHVQVTLNNSKELAVGWVGDQIDYEIDNKDGELYLYATGTIISEEGVKMYEKSGQLSAGYLPKAHWEKGVHKNMAYDAVLDSFRDVNHLLLCKEARGGPQIMIMDSLDSFSPLEKLINANGGNKVDFFKKIFGSRKLPVTGDSKVISLLLQSIAIGADPAIQVGEIKTLMGDAKTDVQKEFYSFLDELAACKEEKMETKAKAVDIVTSFYMEKIVGDTAPALAAESAPKPETKPETEPKPDPVGDSNAVVLKAISDMTKQLTEAVSALKPAPDKKPSENTDALGSLRALVGGDSAPKKTSTDDFIKSLI